MNYLPTINRFLQDKETAGDLEIISQSSYYPKHVCRSWDGDTYEIILVPKNGIYSAEKLNQFMLQIKDGLLSLLDIETDSSSYLNEFRYFNDGLELGYFQFSQKIAVLELTEKFTLADEFCGDETLEKAGFVNTAIVEKKRNGNILRAFYFNVYPDKELALLAQSDERQSMEYKIYFNKLNQAQAKKFSL